MYTFHLTEELARWAFEVVCLQRKDWIVAFTNPTAGPWKTIQCTDLKTGESGEVHRFELEETRPDIVLVNDKLKMVLIVEAKDSIEKLIAGHQASKSIEVVGRLAKVLKSKKGCRFWGGRSAYRIVPALLWGAERDVTDRECKDLFALYRKAIGLVSNVAGDLMVGIETRRIGERLECQICGAGRRQRNALDALAESFGLALRTF